MAAVFLFGSVVEVTLIWRGNRFCVRSQIKNVSRAGQEL